MPEVCARCSQIHGAEPLVVRARRQVFEIPPPRIEAHQVLDRFWEHVASSEYYTALFVHPQRGTAAHQTDISILPSFQNWAVHDCWSTYFNFTGCQHAVCGAHLLGEFTALIESGSK